MNKGRNIAIFLLCLCCVSLLTFLTTLNKDNHSGITDDVRYYLTDTQEEIKYYDFYFVKAEKMTGTLYTDPDSPEYTVTIFNYPFTYTIKGDNKKNAEITYTVTDEEAARGMEPFQLFTRDFFKAMIYGAEPVLTVTEAIIVAFIAAIGGLVIGKAEEIWGFFNKDPEKEYPEWEELNKYRYIGGGILGFAVIFLLCLIFF